jgi:hypothetical protein
MLRIKSRPKCYDIVTKKDLMMETDELNNSIKYFRTFHLPYSPGTTNDDKKLENESDFIGQEVIITAKMDGENCSITNKKHWARSVDSNDHPSRKWIENFWSSIRYNIPDGMRVCGEYLYATHSIHYKNLPSYFLVFSIWEDATCLSWDDTVEWCKLLDLDMVPFLYRGIYDKDLILKLATSEEVFGGIREGVVIRKPESFTFTNPMNHTSNGLEAAKHYTKWVRKGHVNTDEHWMFQKIVPNELKWE